MSTEEPRAATVALDPHAAAPTGRLAVMTAYAVAATVIPIPFVPDRVLAIVRGALVFDVAARHGLSLTEGARNVLADPNSESRTRVARAAESLFRQVLRRLRPVGVLSSASRGIELYALGHLFDRYITHVRATAAVRMHVDEARVLRDAIDRAILRALSPSLRPDFAALPTGHEDLRDEFTRWLDSVVIVTATLPSYLERRLEAAFDEIADQMAELKNG